MIFSKFSLVTPLPVTRRDKLSRQQEWRDELFHVENVVEYVVSCRIDATTLFGRVARPRSYVMQNIFWSG
jgi:hypothetical protein